MNHTELCHMAAKWVRKRRGCSVVLVDVKTISTNEQPDVIGWTNGGHSVLVEVKVSVSVYLRDHKKRFRKLGRGMGRERWYAFPKGMWEKVPEKDRKLLPTSLENVLVGQWGVIEFAENKRTNIISKAHCYSECATYEEKRLLITSVRRVTEGWGRGMIEGVPSDLMAYGDKHPANRIRELEAEARRLTNELAKFNAYNGTGVPT